MATQDSTARGQAETRAARAQMQAEMAAQAWSDLANAERNRDDNTARLIAEEGGFVYDADSYADDVPYYDHRHGRAQLIVPPDDDAVGLSMSVAPRLTLISSTSSGSSCWFE